MTSKGGGPCGVVVNVLYCDIGVNEFELHSHYYIHFRTYIIWKVMTPLYLPSYWLNSKTIVLPKE